MLSLATVAWMIARNCFNEQVGFNYEVAGAMDRFRWNHIVCRRKCSSAYAPDFARKTR